MESILSFLTTIFAFIIALGILVVIHEWGHYFTARRTGMRTDVFSVGMGRRLFGWNSKQGFTTGPLPDNWEFDGTCDYRLALVPIGGYVKIAGMIDESFDTNHVESTPEPYEFRSKGPFAKALVLSAGVICNFILAIVLFAGIGFFSGVDTVESTTLGYSKLESAASEIGLRVGDNITAVNGKPVEHWLDVQENIALSSASHTEHRLTVQRDGNNLDVPFTAEQAKELLTSIGPEGVYAGVGDTQEAGYEAGLRAGDTILSIQGMRVAGVVQMTDMIQANAGSDIAIEIGREGGRVSIVAPVQESGKIGFATAEYANRINVEYGMVASLAYGWDRTIGFSKLFLGSLWEMIVGKTSVKDNLGGPIMIAKSAGQFFEMGLTPFIVFVATLSVILAIMNILPIPALDGGHLVFVIIEGILRREISVKVKMNFQQFGVLVLLGLMLLVSVLDIGKLI